MGVGVEELDPVTSTVVATHAVGWHAFAYDAWSDRTVLLDTSRSGMTRFVWSYLHASPSTWQLGYQSPFVYTNFWPYDDCREFGFTNEQPFEYLGVGCPNGLGREPRVGWRGLPRQGESFTLTLRDAEPNGFALFWLGLSDRFWSPVGVLPYDAGPFGARGCSLWVSADVPFPVAIDGNGRGTMTQSVPVNPALAGFEVFAQTASSSTANTLGFAASDALVIRLR